MSRLFNSLRTTTKTMAPIERITLFKIPSEADRARVLEQYKVLAKTATKVSDVVLFLVSFVPTLFDQRSNVLHGHLEGRIESG